MSTSRRRDRAATGRTAALDAISCQILEILREDGRISVAALAERVGISRATAYSRMEALVADGVITGYSARIDAQQAGLAVCALVFVAVQPQSWTEFRERILDLPDVEYCAVTTGEHDAMLLVRAPDVRGVHQFTTGVIALMPQVRTVVSVVVLDEVVHRPYVLPTDLPERPASASLGMTRWTPAAQGRDAMGSQTS